MHMYIETLLRKVYSLKRQWQTFTHKLPWSWLKRSFSTPLEGGIANRPAQHYGLSLILKLTFQLVSDFSGFGLATSLA